MEVHDLYDGKIQLEFNERNHRYKIDGQHIPSVTAITGVVDKSGPLMGWAVNQTLEFIRDHYEAKFYHPQELETLLAGAKKAYRKTREKAADIGTQVHNWIAEYYKDMSLPLPTDPEVLSSVESYFEFIEEHEVEVVDAEFKVYSVSEDYCGTADLDAFIDGERSILDWKTGGSLYPDHRFQTAGYQYAREEELGVKYGSRWVVLLPRDGGPLKAHKLTDFAKDWRGFQGCLQLYRALK